MTYLQPSCMCINYKINSKKIFLWFKQTCSFCNLWLMKHNNFQILKKLNQPLNVFYRKNNKQIIK